MWWCGKTPEKKPTPDHAALGFEPGTSLMQKRRANRLATALRDVVLVDSQFK
jgi:hypothetical protein